MLTFRPYRYRYSKQCINITYSHHLKTHQFTLFPLPYLSHDTPGVIMKMVKCMGIVGKRLKNHFVTIVVTPHRHSSKSDETYLIVMDFPISGLKKQQFLQPQTATS